MNQRELYPSGTGNPLSGPSGAGAIVRRRWPSPHRRVPRARRTRRPLWCRRLWRRSSRSGPAAATTPRSRCASRRRRPNRPCSASPPLATKNTTRVGGEDPVADAAGAASAVYPGATRGSRPRAVTLVDRATGAAGSPPPSLEAPPLRARSCSPMATTSRRPPRPRSTRMRPTGARRSAGPRRSRSGGRARPTRCGRGGRRAGTRSRSPPQSTRSRPTSAGGRRRTS